jgi:hypothetical protein
VATVADLVLPTSNYVEKKASYLSMNGKMQFSKLAISGPGLSKDD